MHERRKTHLSKLLSLVLRHKPEEFGLSLERGGWVRIDKLIEALALKGTDMTRKELDEVASSGEKRRFEVSADKSKVRATHGHSVKVELDHEPVPPPVTLFHGTVQESVEPIRAQGLQPGDRQYVHLSSSRDEAAHVAMRRGPPVILEIASDEMAKDGAVFFHSASGIWLTREVTPRYIRFPAVRP